MSVEDQLGLAADGHLLEPARAKWATWAREHPSLAQVGEFDRLRNWLRTGGEETDEVLLVLARLAAPDGGDDVDAAAALAWAMIPAAGRVAACLHTLTPDIDQVVAAQLWLEVRSFPWCRVKRRVAANLAMRVRNGVLLHSDSRNQLERVDRTWARTQTRDPQHLGAEGGRGSDSCMAAWLSGTASAVWHLRSGELLFTDPDAQTPAEELLEVLDWACEHDVISDEDRYLLLCLVEEATRTPPAAAGRGNGGLCGREISAKVAPRCGVSEATVRRRVRRSVRALAAAADRFVA